MRQGSCRIGRSGTVDIAAGEKSQTAESVASVPHKEPNWVQISRLRLVIAVDNNGH